jgi:hypothetical protein
MLRGLAGEQDQLPFEVSGSSLLEQSFRSMHVLKAPRRNCQSNRELS